jgi:hypothetical protein
MTDVDNFETYKSQRYNIGLITVDKITILPDSLCPDAKNSCPHTNIISFHPHLMRWSTAREYIEFFKGTDLKGIKQSAEKLLGDAVQSKYPGAVTFLKGRIYANHIGSYRVYSVFPGAKLRQGVTLVSASEIKAH